MAENIVHLKLDAAPFMEALADLEALELREEARDLVVGLFERFDEFFSFNAAPAALAGECWIRLEPTNLFRVYLAAFRAGDFDRLARVEMFHDAPQS